MNGVEWARRLGRLLPPAIAWRLGAALGRWFGALPMRDQGRARAHLALAYPEADPAWIARTARESFAHVGAMALWTLATLHRDAVAARRGVAVEGGEHLRELVRRGRSGHGCLVFTAHFGNWELLARIFPGLMPAALIARRLRWPRAEAFVSGMRTLGGAEIIYQDDDPRRLLRALRLGRGVGTLFDQDIPALDGCWVPFFGRPAKTPSGPAALAIAARVDCRVLRVFRRSGRWVLHCSPLLCVPAGQGRQAAITGLTALATAYFERQVRLMPAQWVWWHPRWRSLPP